MVHVPWNLEGLPVHVTIVRIIASIGYMTPTLGAHVVRKARARFEGISPLRSRKQGTVQGLGFRVQVSGFRVEGLGFRV